MAHYVSKDDKRLLHIAQAVQFFLHSTTTPRPWNCFISARPIFPASTGTLPMVPSVLKRILLKPKHGCPFRLCFEPVCGPLKLLIFCMLHEGRRYYHEVSGNSNSSDNSLGTGGQKLLEAKLKVSRLYSGCPLHPEKLNIWYSSLYPEKVKVCPKLRQGS